MFCSPPTSPLTWSPRTRPLHSNPCHPERSEGAAFLPLLATKSFRIRTSKKCARNPFRIRTSKTQDLKPFRMNTYKKTGGRWAHPSSQRLHSLPRVTDHGSRIADHGPQVMGHLFSAFSLAGRTLFPDVLSSVCTRFSLPPHPSFRAERDLCTSERFWGDEISLRLYWRITL